MGYNPADRSRIDKIRRRVARGESYRMIGEALGISRSRVHQIWRAMATNESPNARERRLRAERQRLSMLPSTEAVLS